MRRFTLSLVLLFAALVAISPHSASAAPPSNMTGTWTVEQTGRNGSTTSTISLTQSGGGIVGTNPATKNSYTGKFVNDTQIDGTWHGPGGAGWLTIYVSPNGHSFNGTWGYHGREANGSFVGNKVLPPSPVTAAGKWNVSAAGPAGPFVGVMTCTQANEVALCHLGDITINGKLRTKDKIRATFKSGTRTGWFSFWFNEDNNSFNGIWGYGDVTSPPQGRVVGQRVLE